MHRFLRDNGLSLVIAGLFAFTLLGQVETGLHRYNEERAEHHQPALALTAYLTTGHFLEATAENWESEFLQMAAYVVLTALLYQRGSAESRQIEASEAVDRQPRAGTRKRNVPWPVRRGGWILKLYENSLVLAFLLLFLISIVLHAIGGMRAFNEEQAAQGGATVSLLQYVQGAQFWFESLQNWQSEFLSLLAMVVLSIFLRQRGSPESKPVDAPHSDAIRMR
jgi:hypothetical protein